MLNIFRKFIEKRWITMAIIGMIAIFGFDAFSHASLDWYGDHKATMVHFRAPTKLLDTETLLPATSARRGHGVVFHYTTHIDAVGCFAVYNQWISGPVMYQFPVTRTSLVLDKSIDRESNMFFTLPAELPVGTYKFYLTTFPTCKGFTMSAVTQYSGLSFEVTK